MKTQTPRTPTPWIIHNEGFYDDKGVYFGIKERVYKNGSKGPYAVGLAWSTNGKDETAKSNADFIVKAVNCHEELLAALKEAVKTVYQDNDVLRWRAIIAKAEGKQEDL